MAKIFCFNCGETVTFGMSCKCFFYENNDVEYSQPRLDILDKTDAEKVEAKDKYTSAVIDNSSKLCSEFQQVLFKDYGNVNSLENLEITLSSDLNRKRNLGSLTDETGTTGIFHNQYGYLISTAILFKNDIYSAEFPSLKFSAKPFKADFKTKTEFHRSCKTERISTSIYHPQRSCEIDLSTSTNQAPNEEHKMMWDKSKSFSFSLEKELPQKSFNAALQKTDLALKNVSVTDNFLVNPNFSQVPKESNKKLNGKSVENLTNFGPFPKFDCRNLVEKDQESIGCRNEATTTVRTSEIHTNLTRYKRRKSEFDIAHGKSVSKRKEDAYQTISSEKTFECDKCKKRFFHRWNLSRHYKTHFACGNCQKIFASEGYIQEHKLYCKKSFVSNFF